MLFSCCCFFDPVAPKSLTINGSRSIRGQNHKQSSASHSSNIFIVEAKEGEKTILICSASAAKPPPKLKWFRKNIELLPGNYSQYTILVVHWCRITEDKAHNKSYSYCLFFQRRPRISLTKLWSMVGTHCSRLTAISFFIPNQMKNTNVLPNIRLFRGHWELRS